MAENITLAFIGDVMLGRGVNDEISLHEPEYFWGDTLPVLRSADAVIANLECAITEHETEWQETLKAFYFRADPKAIDVLKTANIQYASLANNHSLDFEEEGLLDTLKYLDDAGIKHAGAGKNLAEAREPAILEVSGIKVGVVSLTDNEPTFAANGEPGTNYLAINDDPPRLQYINEEVTIAKSMGADFIIVSLHWGPNMVISPPVRFRKFAQAAVDSGANIIHGHSAHIFQGVQVYKNNLIMYDTGDFLDDYAVDPLLRNDWSFIFLVELNREGIQRLKMIPVRLSYAQVNLAKGDEFEAIRQRMQLLCGEFRTKVESTDDGLEITVSGRQDTIRKAV